MARGGGRQNNGADGEVGTSEEKWRRAVAGQSMEPGMLGRGMMRRPSLCWRVFVHRMRRNAPDAVNLMSWRVRWRLGSNEVAEATVKFDFRRKEKRCRITPRLQMEKEG